MFDLYLLTGATGFLGRTIMKNLVDNKQKVRVLAVPNDPLMSSIPDEVEIHTGYIDHINTIESFFTELPERVCLIHCAGIVSIYSKYDKRIESVNVDGTRNILNQAYLHHIFVK